MFATMGLDEIRGSMISTDRASIGSCAGTSLYSLLQRARDCCLGWRQQRLCLFKLMSYTKGFSARTNMKAQKKDNTID
jgi:hypothetical protein